MPESVYWTLFGVLLVWGIFVRSVWTYTYGLPDVTPDTITYIIPAADDPWRPFSEMRTAGVPGLLVLSVGVAGPIGILLAHNVLWLASTVAVTLAVRTSLHAPALSLVVLAYLVLSAKNLVQEYFLMSEHLSRVLYVGYFALALYLLRHPVSRWATVGMAALVLANILAKPSAAVLIVVTLLLLGSLALARHHEARRLLVNAAIFFSVVVGGVLGYMTVYQGKYGTFALSSFHGSNLFSHTGHLIKLDGGIHPELRRSCASSCPFTFRSTRPAAASAPTGSCTAAATQKWMLTSKGGAQGLPLNVLSPGRQAERSWPGWTASSSILPSRAFTHTRFNTFAT
jgi:hypothetical protein